jgi:anti-sigma factor RsiW
MLPPSKRQARRARLLDKLGVRLTLSSGAVASGAVASGAMASGAVAGGAAGHRAAASDAAGHRIHVDPGPRAQISPAEAARMKDFR